MSKLLRQNVGGTDYTMAGCALSATCATAAATAAKVAELTDGDVLADGMSVAIQFTNGNTAASPLTLTVGGVTANICDSRGQNIGGNIWQAGNVVTFLYTFGKFLLLNCVVDEVTLNNMNSVTSNAVFDVTKKYTSGAVTLNPSYVTGGSLEWLRVGKLVILKITALTLTTWSGGDKTIATGLPPAQESIQFFLAPLNSGDSSQLFSVQTDGRLDTNGGGSHQGIFYGSACYFSAE